MKILPIPKKDSDVLKKAGITVDPITRRVGNDNVRKVDGGTVVKVKTRRRWYIPSALHEQQGWRSSMVRFAIVMGASVDEDGGVSIGFIKWLFASLIGIAIGFLIAYKFALALYTLNTIGVIIFGAVVGILIGMFILGWKKGHLITDGLAGSNVPVAIDEEEEDPEKRILVYQHERDFTNVESIPLAKFNEMDFFGGQESKTAWGDPVYSGDLKKGMAGFGSVTPELSNHFIRKRFPAQDRVAEHHRYLLKRLNKLFAKKKITLAQAKEFSDELSRIKRMYDIAEKREYELEEKYGINPYYYKKSDRFISAFMFQVDRYSESLLLEMKTARDQWPNLYKDYMDSTNMMKNARYNLADMSHALAETGSKKFLDGIGYYVGVTQADPSKVIMLNISMYSQLQERLGRSIESRPDIKEVNRENGQ